MSYYLQLAGVEGDAAERGYERWFEIDDITWSVAAQTGAPGRGTRTGKVRWSPLVVTTRAGTALPLLVGALATGQRIRTARLDVVQGQRLVTIRYDLKDVLLGALSLAGSEGAPPVHTFSLDYRKIEITTKRQDAAGGERPGFDGSWTVS